MLDTHARGYFDPLIDAIADVFIKYNISANQITIGAFVVGLTASFFLLISQNIIALTLLWISGILDAVDGSVARRTHGVSSWGTLLDITLDRLVEISMIVAFAIKYPKLDILFILLLSSIIFTMTVFLTVGAVSKKQSKKSFYYQPGLVERTEAFIFLSLIILMKDYVGFIAFIFFLAITYTGLMRLREGYNILKNQ